MSTAVAVMGRLKWARHPKWFTRVADRWHWLLGISIFSPSNTANFSPVSWLPLGVRVWKEPGMWPVLPCPWKSGSITHIKFYILLAGKQATTASPVSKKRYSPGSLVAMATCPKETKEPPFTVGSQFQSIQSMVVWLHVHGEKHHDSSSREQRPILTVGR